MTRASVFVASFDQRNDVIEMINNVPRPYGSGFVVSEILCLHCPWWVIDSFALVLDDVGVLSLARLTEMTESDGFLVFAYWRLSSLILHTFVLGRFDLSCQHG